MKKCQETMLRDTRDLLDLSNAEIERLRARNKRLEEALHLAVRALAEAEAILGGEYGDHYGPLCEMMIGLGKKARAALEEGK